MTVTVAHGDCREVLAARQGPLFDSIVCDPPYHLTSIVQRFGKADAAPCKVGKTGAFARASAGFMGQTWDGGDVAFQPETWRIAYDQLKPGGYLVAFGGTRNYHRLACAIEDAGFEIRDMMSELVATDTHVVRFLESLSQDQVEAFFRCIDESSFAGMLKWIYASGFPKSHNISKAIDRHLGVERPVIGKEKLSNDIRGGGFLDVVNGDKPAFERDVTGPGSPEAEQWDGWGTALKPAFEPIVLARKPVEGSVASNVLKYGTGALNIDACRIAHADEDDLAASLAKNPGRDDTVTSGVYGGGRPQQSVNVDGRWPANILTDGSAEVVAQFPDSDGQQSDVSGNEPSPKTGLVFDKFNGRMPSGARGDNGSASRFYFSAKAGDLDRLGSQHATVKPVDLMRWLCRLITPPGGLILDPFAGSGTTGIAALAEGFDCELIELEAKHVDDINRRLAIVQGEGRHRLVEINEGKKRKASPIPLFGEEDAA